MSEAMSLDEGSHLAKNPPPRPDSKGHRWLPDSMEKGRPVRTKALYPIFADRRTRTGSVLKQFAGEGLTYSVLVRSARKSAGSPSRAHGCRGEQQTLVKPQAHPLTIWLRLKLK